MESKNNVLNLGKLPIQQIQNKQSLQSKFMECGFDLDQLIDTFIDTIKRQAIKMLFQYRINRINMLILKQKINNIDNNYINNDEKKYGIKGEKKHCIIYFNFLNEKNKKTLQTLRDIIQESPHNSFNLLDRIYQRYFDTPMTPHQKHILINILEKKLQNILYPYLEPYTNV